MLFPSVGWFFPGKLFVLSHYVRVCFRLSMFIISGRESQLLEDYWTNFPNEFEVRRRLWSCLTIKQIIMFNVELDTCGLKEEDSEEVLDPFYIDQIECMPIPKIDWGRREEDDVFSHTKDVLARTTK